MLNSEAFWTGYYAAQYERPDGIASRLGVSLADVEAVSMGYVRPMVPAGYRLLTVDLAAKHRTRMAAEAKARGIYMPDLASLTLQAVARDNLFAAVL